MFMLRLMVEIFMPIGVPEQSVRNITVSMAAHRGCTNRLEHDEVQSSSKYALQSVIALFIVVACTATLFESGHGESAMQRKPQSPSNAFAGQFASLWFGAGLVNAALLSAVILPLATAYSVCEGLGESDSALSGGERRSIPFVLIFMLVLINRRGLMREMRNRSWQTSRRLPQAS
jgi:Mn2+/Fe2+ NRAMP family transporter